MRSIVRRMMAVVSRNRAAIVIGLLVALTSSGTAAAVSIVLGGTNTASATTTIKTAKNVAVLQLTNTNSNGGTNAKGLGITVPAGRAPITVNPGAGKATNLNADMVDGMDASAFLSAGGKAEDSDGLDGIDSTGFVRGNGSMQRGAIALPPGGPNPSGQFFLGHSFAEFNVPSPWVGFYYGCPDNQQTTNGFVSMRNELNETINVFVDVGTLDPIYTQLSGSGSQYTIPTLAAGEHLTIQVQSAAGLATFEIFSKHRANDCHAQGQAWYTY